MFWFQVALFVVSVIVSILLAPKATKQSAPTPGEFDATTVDASSPVPVLFGTRLISSANLVWYGDVKTTEIMSESGGGK